MPYDANRGWVDPADTAAPPAFAELTDVDLTDIDDGDPIVWDADTSKVVPGAPGAASDHGHVGLMTGSLSVIFDAPEANDQLDIVVPFACTITKASLLGAAATTGSIVIDIWKDTYANFPPTDADSITASAPPTITTAVKSEDATLTGWTKALAAGDVLRFNVDSVTDITRVTLVLDITRT